jgi:hypothetical protein
MPASTNEPRHQLDITTWASGLAGAAGFDPYLAPAPTITSHVDGSPSAGEVHITASASALFCTPSSPDLHDVYWQETNDNRHRHLPDYNGSVNPVPGSLQLDEALRVQDGFATFGEDVEYYAVGLSNNLSIKKPAVSGTVSASLEIWTPYCWLNLDLAQLIWAVTRFHQAQKLNTDVLLHRDSFIAYSERMNDHRYRQFWNTYRKVDETIGAQMEAVAKQSFAMLTFGAHTSGTQHSALLRIEAVDLLAENARVFDTTRPEDGGDAGAAIFLARRPAVKSADEYLLNQLQSKWGGGVTLTGIAPPYNASLTEPFSPPAEENLVRQRDAASVAKFGLITSSENRPNAIEKGSAEGGFRLESNSARDRTVTWGLGPLHFDFLPGEKIHIRDTLHGLTGDEDLLVRVKTYDLDRPIATMELLELVSPSYTVTPDDLEDMFLWLKADAGITSSGIPLQISQWDDQSGNAYHATVPGGVAGPGHLIAAQNGLDLVDFASAPGGWLEFLHWPTGQEFTRGSNWTLICLFQTRGTSSGHKYILSSQGLNWGSTLDGELTFHTGNPFLGGPNRGPSVWDRHGQNDSTGIWAPAAGVNHWVIGIWRPWATQSNWALSGASRSWVQFIDLEAGSGGQDYSFGIAGIGSGDADPTEGHPGPLAYHDRMQGIGQDTYLGRKWDVAGGVPNIYMAELILYQHDRGRQEIAAYDLDGLCRYLQSKWAV